MPIIGLDKHMDDLEIRTQDLNPPSSREILDQDPERAKTGQLAKDAFFSEGTVGSVIAGIKSGTLGQRVQKIDPSFDPFKHIPHAKYAEDVMYSNTPEEVAAAVKFRDEQDARRRRLVEGGWVGTVFSMGAGIIDPTILIPGTAAIKAVGAGARIARGAVSGAALGATAVGTQEAVLQATQTRRPVAESLINTAAGGIFGGFVGGGIGLLTKGHKAAGNQIVADAIAKVDTKVDLPKGQGGSVGAAEVSVAGGEGLADLNATAAKMVSSPIEGLRSPVIRGATSSSEEMQRFTFGMLETTLKQQKNKWGTASEVSVESQINLDAVKILDFKRDLESSYLKYVGVPVGDKVTDAARLSGWTKAKREGKMSFEQFNEEAAGAAIRGDTHKIPEIQALAERTRMQMDELYRKMKELKIMQEGETIKTAPSYLTRVWDHGKVRAGYSRLVGKIANRFQQTSKKPLTRWEAEQQAEESIDNMLGLGEGSVAMAGASRRMSTTSSKFTKSRVLDIPDSEVEEFLVKDYGHLVSSYMSNAHRMIRFQEYLNSRGVSSLADLKHKLATEAKEKIEFLSEHPKRVAKIEKQLAEDLENMEKMSQVVLGHFGQGGNPKVSSALRTLRKYQFVRLLGSVLWSSMMDMAGPVIRNGLPKVILDGYVSQVRNIKASKMSNQELRDLGIGIDVEASHILASRFDHTEQFGSFATKSERVADNAVVGANKLFALNWWTQSNKRVAGHITTARMMKSLKKWRETGEMTKKDTERFASLGIGEDMYGRISAQMAEYGEEIDGTFLSNHMQWKDKGAQRKFQAAVAQEVRTEVVTPGAGDVPFVFRSNEAAKTMTQFKSFQSAATNKILLQSIQSRDAEVMQGMVALIGLGAASYAIKEKIAGREPSEDVDTILLEAVQRSGVAGLMGDFLLGVNPWGGKNSRFAGQNMVGNMFGPSAGLLQDIGQTIAGVADGEISETDARTIKRLLPLQNLWYLNILMNQMFPKKKKGRKRRAK